jgi:hypothetical protein
MNTLTLTPKNFGKKMSTIYDAVVQSGKITLTIQPVEEEKEMSLRDYIKSGAVDRDEIYGPYTAEEFQKISKTW